MRWIERIFKEAIAIVWVLLGFRRRAIKSLDRKGGCLVVMGHNTRGTFLDSMIRWLKKNRFHFVSQNEVIDFFEYGNDLPDRAVWLTFDDGWKDNVTEVFPVLEDHEVPATVFLATRSMETGYFWFDITRREVNAPHRQIGRFEYEKQTNSRRAELIEELVKNPDVYVPAGAMRVDDIKQWGNHPLLSFENHSHDHVVISQCTDEKLEAEIRTAAEKIEEWTGKKSRIFCYPIGHIDPSKVEILRRHGVLLAVTAEPRPWFPAGEDKNNRYFIPRVTMLDSGGINLGTCHLVGASPFAALGKLKRWARKS